MNKEKKNLLTFGYGLAVISAVMSSGGFLKHGISLAPIVLAVCSVVFCAATAYQWEALRPAYKGWMAVAHVIGAVVTTVILSVVYFAVFAPVGIVFRLAGKDHLKRRWDVSAPSYWIIKKGTDEPERYRQQF